MRAIDCRLEGVGGAEPLYRLLTTILDHDAAPAHELAALCHERWEIETALDELKTHPRGARVVLRSKTPDLVRQEFHGLMMAHLAVRSPIHEAALRADEDPDRLSLSPRRARGASKAARRHRHPPRKSKAFHDAVLDEILRERVVSSRNRQNPRAVKRKMSKFPPRRPDTPPLPAVSPVNSLKVIRRTVLDLRRDRGKRDTAGVQRRLLSNRFVGGLSAEDRDIIYRDRNLPGFRIPVYRLGARVYLEQDRDLVGSRRATVDRQGAMPADEARRRAAPLRAAVEAREEPNEDAGATVAELAERYLREHVAVRCKPRTLKRYRPDSPKRGAGPEQAAGRRDRA